MPEAGNGDQREAPTDLGSGPSLGRHLVRSTAANYVGQFVTLLVWFLLTPFILDRLGATLYGLWVLVASFLAYGVLLDFGINGAVVKYVAEHRARGESEKASSLVASTLWIYFAVGAGVLVLGVAAAPTIADFLNLPPEERDTAIWLIRLTALGLALELPAGTSFAVLRGLQRFDLMNLIGSAAMLTLAAGTVVVLLLGGGVLGMAAIAPPLTLLWQIPAIIAIRRTAPDLRFGLRGARRSQLRTVASFSSALFALNTADTIKKKTDELVIGASLPIASVAPYSVARRVSELPELLTYQFVSILMPLASQLQASGDRRLLREIFVNACRVTLGIFLAVGIGMVVFARPLLVAWVGEAYAKDAIVIVILIGAGLAEAAMWPAIYILQGIDRHRPLVVFAVSSAVVNLGLSIALVGPLGVKGVAYGTLIATALEVLVVLPFALRSLGIRAWWYVRDAFLPATLSAIPAGLALVLLREGLGPSHLVTIALAGMAGAVVYAAAFLAFPQAAPERGYLQRGAARLRRRPRGV